MPRPLAAAACLAALLLPAACTVSGSASAPSAAPRTTGSAGSTATSSAGSTATSSAGSTAGPEDRTRTGTGTSTHAGTNAAADFEQQLREQLQVPAVPAFAIPTDLLASAQDRDIADRLRLEPGLYRGIAVLGARCDGTGVARSVDTGPQGRAAAGGSYRKGAVSMTVKRDGTGVYNAPDLHVAVLPGGAGVYEDGDVRLAVQRGGAGTYTDATRRLTVRTDGSGSYTSGATRLWVGADGAGGYSDASTKASVGADGAVSGTGDRARLAAVARVVRDRLPRFAPVPAVRRVTATGRACGTVIRLDGNVLFDFGSAGLRPDSRALLNRVAALLRFVRPGRVQVNGYTDSIGPAAANLGLSRDRADAVRDALAQRSVSAGSMTARGLGEAHPVRKETTATGADGPAARQLNRRVDIVLPNRWPALRTPSGHWRRLSRRDFVRFLLIGAHSRT